MRCAHATLHRLVGVLLVGLLAPRAALAADDELALDLGEKSTLVVRKIPRGSFVQGSPANEPLREADELLRKVTLTRPFWLGRTLVTRAQFSLFASETRHITDAEKGQSGGYGIDPRTGTLVNRREFNWRNPGFVQRDDDPVVLVTFGDANAFVAWASRKTNRRVRLPTEAEWEYAARGGTTTPWFAASTETEALQIAWFRLSAGGSTHPVATRRANPFGLFDMAGNVQEWCRDVYAPYPAGEVVDPEMTSTAESERRVLRGGSWLKDPKRGRSAARNKGAPGSKSAENGFRVAVDDDPTAPVGSGIVPSGMVTPPPSSTSAALDVDAGSTSFVAPAPPRSEGGGSTAWSLWLAPLAAAVTAVGWVLLRRRSTRARAIPRSTTSTLRMPHAPGPAPVGPSVPRASAPASARLSIPPGVVIGRRVSVPPPVPSSTRRMPAAPSSSVPTSSQPTSSRPTPPSHPAPSSAAPSSPASSSPRVAPIDLPSDPSIPLSLPAPPASAPRPSPSPGVVSSMTGPPPPPSGPADARDVFPAPPPAPFPLAASMLPPPSGSRVPPAPLSSGMTGPPAPLSSGRTGPPAPPSPVVPPDSVSAAPLATLLAALSSRPLLLPAVTETLVVGPSPVRPPPDPDVTAPYPALSSSVLVDDPDVTAPFPVVKPSVALPERSSDEGPPSPRRDP